MTNALVVFIGAVSVIFGWAFADKCRDAKVAWERRNWSPLKPYDWKEIVVPTVITVVVLMLIGYGEVVLTGNIPSATLLSIGAFGWFFVSESQTWIRLRLSFQRGFEKAQRR